MSDTPNNNNDEMRQRIEQAFRDAAACMHRSNTFDAGALHYRLIQQAISAGLISQHVLDLPQPLAGEVEAMLADLATHKTVFVDHRADALRFRAAFELQARFPDVCTLIFRLSNLCIFVPVQATPVPIVTFPAGSLN